MATTDPMSTADAPDPLRGYVGAGMLCAAAAVLLFLLQSEVDSWSGWLPFAVFSVAVSASAWAGGAGPGLFATLVGAVSSVALSNTEASRFLSPPPAVAVSLVAFALMGGLVSLATRSLHRRALAQSAERSKVERALRLTTHLEELTAALSRGRTSADVQRASLIELTHAMLADAALFALTADDDTTYDVVWTLGLQGRQAQTSGSKPMNVQTPLTEAIRRQELTIFESPEVGDLEFADRRADPVFQTCETAVVVPLMRANRAFGAVALSFNRARQYDGDERQFLWSAAGRIAQALDRAHVYETTEHARAEAEAFRMRADEELRERERAEERLRESEAKYRALATRTNRLYELNAGLSEAISVEAVSHVIVRQGKAVSGASAAAVSMLVDGGRSLETVGSEDLPREIADAWRRYPVTNNVMAAKAIKTGQPVFVTSFAEWQKHFPGSATVAADGGYTSAVALPLVVESSVVGVLTFAFTAPVNFDAGYAGLLRSVAQHSAQALDRARLYESSQAARRTAEEANQSKDEFLSTVSHELRTPLNAMLGWASLLRNGSLDPSRTTRAIEAVFNNATRQAHLIEELLDVSRIVAGRAPLDPQPLDLAENVRGAIEAMMPLADAKGLEVQIGQLPRAMVRADPRRLEQVFLNLLSNAVKFTPTGGRVSVEMSTSDSTVEVKVSDTGAGIDRAFLPFVFDRFRQADSTMARSVGGLGLGLFIARHLVEAQDGRLSAQSEGPGRGSTFIVTLPLLGPRHEASAVRPRALPLAEQAEDRAPSLAGIRVLLVDDEPDAREVMASALESCGATVVSATSAADALHALRDSQVDVMLADLAMPGTDGYALIREVRSHLNEPFAAIPAAAVTASARDDERQRALDAGFQLHLAKPVRPASLALTVATLARGVLR